MKAKFLIFLTLMLATAVIAAGQSKMQEMRIKEKGTAHATKKRITVKFLEVLEDSRCPEGVDCVWAGNAKIKLELSKKGEPAKVVELNTGMGDKSVVFGGYEIYLVDLLPHRKAGVENLPGSYEAVITAQKQKSPTK